MTQGLEIMGLLSQAESEAEWEAFKDARKQCSKLDYYWRLHNIRANLIRRTLK